MTQMILDGAHHRLAFLVHLPPVFGENLPPLRKCDDRPCQRADSRDRSGDVEERRLRQRPCEHRADSSRGKHARRQAQPARGLREDALHLLLEFLALRAPDEREIDPVQQLRALLCEVREQRQIVRCE